MTEKYINSKKINSSPVRRFFAPTPKFFKHVQIFCVALGAMIGAISMQITTSFPDSLIPTYLGTVAACLVVIAPLIAQFSVEWSKIK
jgi:hypothetical protein